MIAILHRALPMALAVGGVGLTVHTGGNAVGVAQDMVKAVLSRTEIEMVAKAIGMEHNAQSIRQLERVERWEKFLRESLTSRSGRDTAMDLWGTPYELFTEKGKWKVRSLGANRAEDYACDDGAAGGISDPDTLLARIGGLDNEAVEYTEAGDRIVGDDDICMEVTFFLGDEVIFADPDGGRKRVPGFR